MCLRGFGVGRGCDLPLRLLLRRPTPFNLGTRGRLRINGQRRRPSLSVAAQCQHLFVTAQGSAYARFRRALDSRNATVALATATELDFVSLPDALELVLLLADDPRRFRGAALRWHARYCGEVPGVGFEEAQAVLACLAGLAGGRPKPAAAALAELARRRGLERATVVLARWAS